VRVSPWLVATFLVVGACTKSETAQSKGANGAPASVSEGTAAAVVDNGRATFNLQAEGGVAWGSAVPKGHGYSLQGTDGNQRGKVKIDPDQVKIKDGAGATAAKAKAKAYGFKIYEGERAVAKIKHKSAGYLLSHADGSELGTLNTKGAGGVVGGATITVKTQDAMHVVVRDGETVGGVGVEVSPRAAAFLGVTELKYEQRLAAVIYFQEHLIKPREP